MLEGRNAGMQAMLTMPEEVLTMVNFEDNFQNENDEPVYLSTCPPVHLSTCPLVHLSTCPLVHLSTCPPVHLSTKETS